MKIAQLILNMVIFTPATGPIAVDEEIVNLVKNESSLIIVPPNVQVDSIQQPGELEIYRNYLEDYGQRAAKDDDATIPVLLWNRYLFSNGLKGRVYHWKHGIALERFRRHLGYRWYKRSLVRSFLRYLRREYGADWFSTYHTTKRYHTSKKRKRHEREGIAAHTLSNNEYFNIHRDLIVGRDCITRAVNASWWEWLDGSTCFFWRWPSPIRHHVHDGYPVFVQGRLPSWKKKQNVPKQKAMALKMKDKLEKVTNRRYIIPGTVHSLIHVFAVAKGETDIRLVYDGTKSRLNECTFAPNFFLPSIDSMLMTVNVSSWFGDHDLGEMFLNYCLNSSIQKYSGVDLTKVLGSDKVDWRVWLRTSLHDSVLEGHPFNPRLLASG